MSRKGLTYSGKNMKEAKEQARKDNQQLKDMGSDARILIDTMKWDRSAGLRTSRRYYTVDYTGYINL